MKQRRAWATVPWLLWGCGQVLGIEDAHLDPALASGGSGSAALGGAASHEESAAGVASAGDRAADAGHEAAGAPELAGAAGEGGARSNGGTGSNGGASGAAAAANGGTSGAAAATSGGTSGGGSLCQRYCAAVSSGCTDKHAQYLDLEACLAICPLLPVGTQGDVSGNTINCRFTYAQKASAEPYTYCTWAGPGGDGRCGSNCDGFCTVMMQACTASSVEGADTFFASSSSCMSACAALPDIGNYSATDTSLQVGADHVQCRLYHVDAAVTEDDPTTHCPHAMGRKLCHAP